MNTAFVLYVILSVIPVVSDLKNNRRAMARLAQVTSVGVHRRPQVVSQVIREEKTDRIIRGLVTLQRLQDAASRGFKSGRDGLTSERLKEVDPVELSEISKTFDAFDGSGDGEIASTELAEVMRKLGAPTTTQSLAAMMDVLDANGDGSISKDEFVTFFAEQILTMESTQTSTHQQANFMFEMFDQDGSGEITIGEVKQVLDAFQVGFTVDEVGDLVNELDEGDNGSVGKHEFHELLVKHKHLFEKWELPKLY